MQANEIVNRMMASDPFSQWLGLNVTHVTNGSCSLEFTLREEMMNGFGQAHGGVLFSAADSALAFASNGRGRVAVAIDASVSFTTPGKAGDRLFVTAEEIHLGNKTALYEIKTVNERGELVSFFKGSVYRTGKVYE